MSHSQKDARFGPGRELTRVFSQHTKTLPVCSIVFIRTCARVMENMKSADDLHKGRNFQNRRDTTRRQTRQGPPWRVKRIGPGAVSATGGVCVPPCRNATVIMSREAVACRSSGQLRWLDHDDYKASREDL